MRWRLVVALAVASLAAVIAAAQPIWSIHISSDATYVGVPVWFYANHYDPYLGEVYNLTCNITLADEYGPIWTEHVEGAPVNYTFTINHPGDYTLYYSCRASNNETAAGELSLTVAYPTPSVDAVARWGRQLALTIATPYPYTGVSVVVYYKGEVYPLTLEEGTATLSLPPITKPETVIVELFDVNNTFEFTPATPEIAFNATVEGDRILFIVNLVDELGTLPPTPISVSVDGPCRVDESTFYTGVVYEATVERNPLEPVTCTFKVKKQFWPGETKSAAYNVTVPPAYVVAAELAVDEIAPWHYIIAGTVQLSEPVNATVTLLLDDDVVDVEAGIKQVFDVYAELELEPGVHYVTLLVNNITVATKIIEVPRHPYPFPPPPPIVYAGSEPYNLPYYYTYREGDTLYIIAYYPGDDYYAPTTRVFTTKIIEPVIAGDEDTITIVNASKGAIVAIYCLDGGNERLIYEKVLDDDEAIISLTRFNCPAIKVVYENGDYVKTTVINTIEGYTVATTNCVAGTPCTPVASAEHLAYATINGAPYTPDRPITLPPGLYTLTLYFRDGLTATVTIYVEPVTVLVIVEEYPSGWVIKTVPDAPVTVTLADGRIITVEGEASVWAEPVSFYSEYYDLVIVRR